MYRCLELVVVVEEMGLDVGDSSSCIIVEVSLPVYVLLSIPGLP